MIELDGVGAIDGHLFSSQVIANALSSVDMHDFVRDFPTAPGSSSKVILTTRTLGEDGRSVTEVRQVTRRKVPGGDLDYRENNSLVPPWVTKAFTRRPSPQVSATSMPSA